jgi:hypothetical protein
MFQWHTNMKCIWPFKAILGFIVFKKLFLDDFNVFNDFKMQLDKL